MNRANFLLLIFVLLLFRCMSADEIDTANIVSADSPIQVSVLTAPFTKGAIVDSYDDMVSMGVYCALTGEGDWSTSTEFEKLDNRRFTISSDGSWVADGSPEYWGYETLEDKYTIHAYSPHSDDIENLTARIDKGKLYLDYIVADSSVNQPDLMFAVPQMDITPQKTGSAELLFYHALSCVYFSLKTTTDVRITAVNLKGVINNGTLKWGYAIDTLKWTLETLGTLEELGDNGFTVEMKENYTLDDENTAQLNTDQGYLMMLPQVLTDDAKVTLKLSNGDIKEMNLPTNIEWEGGMKYHYILDLEEEVCDFIYDSSEISNCYIINPTPGEATFVQIPIEERINDFWKNYVYNGSKKITNSSDTSDFVVSLVWEDFDEQLCYDYSLMYDDEGNMAVQFIFDPKYQEGNFVFAIQQATGSEWKLWSWHLWFTDYNPDAIAKQNKSNIIADSIMSYTLDGYDGAVCRYADGDNIPDKLADSLAVWSGIYNNKFIMDRNIGERNGHSTNNGAGTVYYQFGRKDPFPSSAGARYTTSITQPNFRSVSGFGFYYSVYFCADFFVTDDSSSDNWCNDTAARNPDYIWYDINLKTSGYTGGKSIFDPSPLGWCVPVSPTWLVFDGVKTNNSKYYSVGASGGYYYSSYRDNVKSNAGAVYSGDGIGYVWSATPSTDVMGCSFSYCDSLGVSPVSLHMTYGLPIRPIQE